MPFVKPLPNWEAPGIEPPLSLRQNGWKAGVKPPDEYFNYLQNRAYEALKELQENAVHKDDAGSGVTNLGFRGLLVDINGIGGTDHINKYPEGLSAMYTDRSDWAVFLNMTDFISATEFLFVETNKTIQDGKVNATQQITRYKKENPSIPVKLVSQYKRVWYSDASYTGWSNAEKVVYQSEFATHMAERATLTKVGHTQLSNAVNSTDEDKAATPKAVKTAYDRADAAFTSAGNGKVLVRDSITGKGGVVQDADGDGFPTFQELKDGVNGLRVLPETSDFRSIGLNTPVYYTSGALVGGQGAEDMDSDGNLYVNTANTLGVSKLSPDRNTIYSTNFGGSHYVRKIAVNNITRECFVKTMVSLKALRADGTEKFTVTVTGNRAQLDLSHKKDLIVFNSTATLLTCINRNNTVLWTKSIVSDITDLKVDDDLEIITVCHGVNILDVYDFAGNKLFTGIGNFVAIGEKYIFTNVGSTVRKYSPTGVLVSTITLSAGRFTGTTFSQVLLAIGESLVSWCKIGGRSTTTDLGMSVHNLDGTIIDILSTGEGQRNYVYTETINKPVGVFNGGANYNMQSNFYKFDKFKIRAKGE